MKLFFNRAFALIALLLAMLMLVSHGCEALAPAFALLFMVAAVIASNPAKYHLRARRLGAAPDTNDIAADLNLNEILDSAIIAFKRAMLPLTMFATVFRNVQLRGTDIVDVPYYPIQGAQSKDYNRANGYQFATGAGSQTLSRPITVNKRKYQTLQFTGYELARLPMLNAQTLGELKGQKLAYDVIQDILSVVTTANYGAPVFTGAANTFDSDNVIDIRTACGKNTYGPLQITDGATNTDNTLSSPAQAKFFAADEGLAVAGPGIPAGTVIASIVSPTQVTLSQNTTATAAGLAITINRPYTPWPETGRGLLLNPDYDGSLLKDHTFSQAYSIGTTSAIQEGRLPKVFGFDYASSAAIPGNGMNLVGMATYMSAILAAFSPIEPPKSVRDVMTRYEIVTDDESEISIEYRQWGQPQSDTDYHVLECNYGYAVGEQTAIKPIVSA